MVAKETSELQETQLTNSTGRQHFHTFDALRFFAFLKVFLLHIPITSFVLFNYIRAGGGLGVQFFFTLSGFLITYIICDEKERLGNLDLKNFFARRILRIWPLFYFMIGVAFLTPYVLDLLHLSSSPEGYQPNWLLSCLFLENYKIMMEHGMHPNVSPLGNMWSLCVEEHFYIIWGVVLFFIKVKDLPKFIITCLIIAPIFRIVYFHFDIPAMDIFTHADLFAYGAIPAYLLVKKKEQTLTFINQLKPVFKQLFLLSLILAVFIISQYARDEKMLIWGTSILGLFFAVFITFILPKDSYFKISDRNILSRLGVFTYGLYLYHSLAINLLKQLFIKFHIAIENNISNSILFFTLSLLLSIVCAYFSYHLFEKQFLKLKKYFRK